MVSPANAAAPARGADTVTRRDLIERIFVALERSGPVAFLDEMLPHSTEDVEVQPYSAEGASFRGADAVREYANSLIEAGTQIHTRRCQTDVEGDTVVVSGSIRVVRGDGAFAETQVRWLFHFAGDLISGLTWEPRAGGQA
jgi:ketosteroid isomerase-like protein